MRYAPILAFAAAFAAPAAGQAWSDPGMGVGAHLSLSRSDDATAARLSGGVRVRARLTGGLALEGSLDYRTEELGAAGAPLVSLRMLPVQGSALLFLAWRGRVQPYLLGGIGYYYVMARGEGANAAYGSRSENKFGFHGGAGVEARVTPRASFTADVRWVSLDVDAASALSGPFGVKPNASYWSATGGAVLYF